jgi:hypothetical protein
MSEVPRHEDVLDSGGIAPAFIDLGTRWSVVASMDRRLGWTQGRPERRCQEKSFASTGNRTQVVQTIFGHYVDWSWKKYAESIAHL